VIDDQNEQLGILTPQAAIKIAEERGLDLVEVAPTANPPVCRIMDYGKYLYQLNKKLHEAKKHQKNITVKEVKFRPNTDEHDYEFKKNHIVRFLQQGDKVKATVFFRGREIVHQGIGRALLDRLVQEIAEVGSVEARPKMEGPNLIRRHAFARHILTKKSAGRKRRLGKAVVVDDADAKSVRAMLPYA
jgi:translation initiation factor IF-3